MGETVTKVNNVETDVSILGAETTYEFSSSGTDTATTKYYDLDGPAQVVNIRCDKVVQITTINGTALTDPITIQTTGFTLARRSNSGLLVDSIIVRTTEASTNIKVFAY